VGMAALSPDAIHAEHSSPPDTRLPRMHNGCHKARLGLLGQGHRAPPVPNVTQTREVLTTMFLEKLNKRKSLQSSRRIDHM